MTTRSNNPYTPKFLKAAIIDGKPVQGSYTDLNLVDSNSTSINSFKYDPLDFPIKSTQQLNVDWSQFQNHCFFSSAEVKVNESFNKIINNFPFDGTKAEIEEFIDTLTGFEKWVFDSFPQWQGALHFSGTQVGEEPGGGFPPELGTCVIVKDKSGATFPDISKNNTGDPIINPANDDSSLSIELLLYLPAITNDCQVVFQKLSAVDTGITFYLEPSISSTVASAKFCVASGSIRNDVSLNLSKGIYNHVCLILNKETKENSLQAYVNEVLVSSSSYDLKLKKLNIDSADFYIGSGSSFKNRTTLITPAQTFSGSIDEFRLFHSVRDIQKQKLYSSKGIYASEDLKLYYRFNEPSGSLSPSGNINIESIVLDSSGNSLHGKIRNYSSNLRLNAAEEPSMPMSNEKDIFKKILFPSFSEVTNLNLSLLSAAKDYDLKNPNIITRLIPPHYLLEGAADEGFDSPEGNGGDPYGGDGIPGQGKRGSVQIILSFLYIWSKFFDELKTYLDSFATLKNVRYESDPYDTVPDNFLEDLVRDTGFYLPRLFTHATLEQYASGENVVDLAGTASPLKKIQSTLLRRVLVNIPDVLRSKGTQHSIRSFLRSVGIDPDNSLKIREYGGPTTKQLTSSREKKFESLGMVQFGTSSLTLIKTAPLSASRVEPGFPNPLGSFVYDLTGNRIGTTASSDGLLTSGSWHVESVFKIPPQNITNIIDLDGNQSLLRMTVTGSSVGCDPGLIVNVVATQFVQYPRTPATIQAYVRSGMSTGSPYVKISVDLSGSGIFDGDHWNVSFGCQRNDEIGSDVSSSYYLRVGKSSGGLLGESYMTSSYFEETPLGESNAFRLLDSTYNASGSCIEIGPNRSISTSAGYMFLNDPFVVLDGPARTTDFVGWSGNLRFWSKSMSESEWKEHVRNPKSLGVSVPKTNYNFVDHVTGSFQKLRLDTLTKQIERNADSLGAINLLDFSLNNVVTLGTGFNSGTQVIVGDMFEYSLISPNFDEASTDDKVRIRSFNDPKYIEDNPWATITPSYLNNAAFQEEEPQDDPRLSIEFSVVDSLDRDMINMFSDLDVMSDALGSPDNMFSTVYPDLETLRDVYFNRLSGKIDFKKFLDFYRWFDMSISTFIEQLVPRKTRYKGTNYVIESHMLERHKNVYRHSDNYLGDLRRITDDLRLQQISGIIKKY